MKVAARLLPLLSCLCVLACSGDDGGDNDARADGGRPADSGTDAGDLGVRGAGTALLAHQGGLVVAGAGEGRGTDFLLARFDTTGRLDPAFGDGGVVLTDFEGNGEDPAAWSNDEAVVLAADGDLLVAAGVGRGPGGSPGVSMALARYTRDGRLDTAFGGGDGRVISDFNPGSIENDSAIRALAVLPDRRIYAGGSVYNGSERGRDFVIVRYQQTGALDTAFSGGSGAGVVRHFASGEEEVRGLVLQGTRVVAGGGSHFRVARFLDTGALDTDFGMEAGSTTHTGGEAFAMAQRPDGRLVLAGHISQPEADGGTTVALKVVQYSADGVPDSSFGTGGAVVHSLGANAVVAVKGLAVEPSGKLAIFTTLVAGGFPVPGVVRLQDNGALDTGFATGGVLRRDDVPLPLLAPAFNVSGNGAVQVGGALWFTDTRLNTVSGNRVLLERAPLP
jgi:uncharacterized delta-60 repeat protein